MKNIINNIIIIGGGSSLQKGIDLGLYERIKNKCTFVLNYEYKYFDGTVICFSDTNFYNKNKEELKTKSLIIGVDQNLGIQPLSNTYIFPLLDTWHDTLNIKEGLYTCHLTGYMAISLAMWLLNNQGNIYLLGYDFTRRTDEEKLKGIKADPNVYGSSLNNRANTHCHTDTLHRGIGYTSYYETTNPDTNFLPFLNKKEIHIYNVSPKSNITCFPKINYLEFFKQINDSPNYNPQELQSYIKNRLSI